MSSATPSTDIVIAPAPDTTDALAGLLVRALRALGDAGEPEPANRLAGQAWAALRHERPAAAQRINGLMHRLARQEASLTTREEPHMPTQELELDVRSEPPARRHHLIFETYEGLEPGAAFVLVNDHDPKPLYYQFAAEQPDRFSWDYLEQGPDVWRVRIGRTA
jgi:uncharacterized protein (DUF2249 family)